MAAWDPGGIWCLPRNCVNLTNSCDLQTIGLVSCLPGVVVVRGRWPDEGSSHSVKVRPKAWWAPAMGQPLGVQSPGASVCTAAHPGQSGAAAVWVLGTKVILFLLKHTS